MRSSRPTSSRPPTQTLERFAKLVYPPNGSRDEEQLINDLHDQRDAIDNALREVLDEVSSHVGFRLPGIKLRVQRIEQDQEIPTTTRILFDPAEHYGNHPAVRNCGHLVTLKPGKHQKTTWKKLPNNRCGATVECSQEASARILVDVALDIALFRGWQCLCAKYNTPTKRKQCSNDKARFLRSLQSLPLSEDIVEPGAGYVAFASACRSQGKLLVQEYVSLWARFILPKLLSSCVTFRTARRAGRKQLRLPGPIKGQVSIRRLAKALKALPAPRDQVLVLLAQRPASAEVRQRLLKALSLSRWRRCGWALVPKERAMDYVCYWPHVNFLAIR